VQTISKFTPTPELVHGIDVGSPVLAAVFRKAGVFSGKFAKNVQRATVDEIRSRHRLQQEQQRREIEAAKRQSTAV
jgi:hypothetical protein